MNIKIDKDNTTPLYIQIFQQIEKMIVEGILPLGYKLPPERKLADTLGVNRTTVLNAYRELKAKGLVDSHVGQGTVVGEQLNDASLDYDLPVLFSNFYSNKINLAKNNVTKKILEIANNKDMISFAAGVANPDLNPEKEVNIIINKLIKDKGIELFQHTPVQGLYDLKVELSKLMEDYGVFCSPHEIMVTSGAQQGISLCSRLFINPGDIVFVEEPSFFNAKQEIEMAGAKIIGIPVDENGMKMETLETMLKRFKPKFIYTIPTFHNPTSSVLSNSRRTELLSLACRYQTLIIEDDTYGDLC